MVRTSVRTQSPTREIFGRFVSVEADQGSRVARVLDSELSIYPLASRSPDLMIRLEPELPVGQIANPAEHVELPDGFLISSPGVSTCYHVSGGKLVGADLWVASRPSGISGVIRKWRNMQFNSPLEMIGQKFHEQVMVPAIYWSTDHFPVHSSGFRVGDGAVLVGGTGGVGKTTLAVELCLRRGASFLNDDLAVIDESGHVLPNLAFPKIYAYNTDGDHELAERLLSGRPIGDRAQWELKRLRRTAMVRRRASPRDLYGRFENRSVPLRRYIIIVREHRQKITVEEVDGKTASELTVQVMLADYAQFHRHVAWHAFNRLAAGKAALIDLTSVANSWRRLSGRVFAEVECMIARVPTDLAIGEYREKLLPVVLGGPRLKG